MFSHQLMLRKGKIISSRSRVFSEILNRINHCYANGANKIQKAFFNSKHFFMRLIKRADSSKSSVCCPSEAASSGF